MVWFWKKEAKRPPSPASERSPPQVDRSLVPTEPPLPDAPRTPPRPGQPPPGPDYAWVDSREKAEALVRSGELVALLMCPEAFGGEPVEKNIVYVPPLAAGLKEAFEEKVVRPMTLTGKPVEYSVEPQYVGGCFVPTSLRQMAHDSSQPRLNVIRIWTRR